jgi:hypothetical protein
VTENIPYADRYQKGRGLLADALPGGRKYTGALGKPFKPTAFWRACPDSSCDLGAALVADDGTILDCWCETLVRGAR